MLFCDYYKQWISVYKEGAIRPVTMNKYNMAHNWLIKLIPDLIISDLDRITYQKLLNDYAAEHERQTTMDFHHHLKCAILDAVDEGLILHDPTRKAIIKGKPPREKKPKYLNQYELHKGELSYNHGNSKLAKYGTVFSLQTYEEALVPRVYHSFKVESGSADFIEYYFSTKMPNRELRKLISSGARMDGLLNIGYDDFMGIKMMFPSTLEQDKIAEYFRALDHLITLHQRKQNGRNLK